jgi:PKD repeat protein
MHWFRGLIAAFAIFALSVACFAGQVPANFLGMTFNMTQTPWQVSPGTIRLWDTGTAWVWMNPSPGVYSFSTLDTWLGMAKQRHVDVIYTFGRTPQWASSNPSDTYCHYGPGQCDFPSNIKYWDDFVTAVVSHVRSWNQANGNSVKVYWETWNEPNTPTWNGSYAQMVQLEQALYNIAHSIDSSAVVLTPCPQGSRSFDWMQSFFAAGGAPYNDVIAFHGYLGSSGGVANPAENLIAVMSGLRSAAAQYGQSGKQFWDTEYAWDSGDNNALPNLDDRAAFLAKSFVLHWSLGISRLVWYMYENKSYGTLWSSTTGLQKPGLAFNSLSQWLKGANMTSACTANSSSTFSCPFVDASGAAALFAWNSHATVSFDTGGKYSQYRDVYGGVHAMPSNGIVSLGNMPLLFTGGAAVNQPPTAVLTVSPSSGTTPLVVSATGSASHDAQGHAVSRSSINFGDGSTVAGPTASHTYNTAGTYTVTLTVWDSNNLSDTASAQVVASPLNNPPPVAALQVTPSSGTAALTVSASMAGSTDLAGTITSSVINFGDGTVVSGPNASHVYASAGSFTVTGTVRDSRGMSASATAHVSVSAPPTTHKAPNAVLQVSPQAGAAPMMVTASTTGSSDPSGSSVTSIIDFGDGAVVAGPTATHNYTKPGSYKVSATVRNTYGMTAVATARVKASNPNADFHVDASPSSGSTTVAAYELTITPQDLLYSPISLSCKHLPAGAACSFTPSVVTPGQQPAHSLLTITLPYLVATNASPSFQASGLLGLWLPLPGLALVGAGLDRKRWTRRKLSSLLLGCLLLTAILLQAGCGGTAGSNPAGGTNSTPQNAITVVAASASHSHTITIYLTPRRLPGGRKH